MTNTDGNNQGRQMLSRRQFMQGTAAGVGLFLGGAGTAKADDGQPGPPLLQPAKLAELAADRVKTSIEGAEVWIPKGTRLREVARSGQPPATGAAYPWHPAPDGGATFRTADGGWVYVSNSEMAQAGQGGVGALRFDSEGKVESAYSICEDTTNNCAGGPTPWGTWLSCEEIERGQVFECDPMGRWSAEKRPAMGAFVHEAVAVDPAQRALFMTEDHPQGCFYRFVPDQWPASGVPDLSQGRLEVAVVSGDPGQGSSRVRWAPVPDPQAQGRPTREQVPEAARFDGGEGMWHHDGRVYFSTKGDNRIWLLKPATNELYVVFEKGSLQPPINDVDNLTVSRRGEVLVAEDGPEMRLVVLEPDSRAVPLLDFVGHRGSEITGPAFSPAGDRLYFSSQRGPGGQDQDGRTYELSGLLALL